MPGRTVRLTGWGRVSPSFAELAIPATAAGAAEALSRADRGVVPHGLGRSYNNAAQCDGGVVISTARLNRIIELDAATGLVTCEAGVSLEQLMVGKWTDPGG
jgi:decaprenylphospho-beta-D-ribofuranose 2-oxidase